MIYDSIVCLSYKSLMDHYEVKSILKIDINPTQNQLS